MNAVVNLKYFIEKAKVLLDFLVQKLFDKYKDYTALNALLI